ncbi:MAG: rRNA pseudouridine synthase, partial [Eggerthellaceae bacterium]|nr:rRNA pseudouridine synthase [Eggerthellaceae bacterium]
MFMENEMRLQKFLARSGVASRRASEELITSGVVAVNGQVVSELGAKVNPASDVVTVKGKRVILPEESVTIMLHKPAGYTTTMADPHAKHTVAELVPVDENPGLFPVGRLDTDTTGLLLFSTDGELGNALLHPKKHVAKTYIALVEGAMSDETAMRLSQGVKLSDGMTLPADVRIARGREARVCAALIGDGQGASGKTKRHEGKR